MKTTLMSILLTLILLIFANSSESSHYLSAATLLPYQAHSFNDLGITRHLLLKGVKYFKFDLSLADRSSCTKFSSWDGKNTCFASAQFAQEICCLAMRGDAGSENNFFYQFNTSDEFVGLFENFMTEHGKEIPFIFFAIDFQFSFELENFLVERFVHQLGTLTVKYRNLHIAIANNFILSYDQLCREDSQKQFIAGQSCTPIRKEISDSFIVLQSSANHPYDSRDYKGRVRNFNIYYHEVDRLCRDSFPTWPNKFPQYPLIFWQPSNEDQIQSTLRKLMSPACSKKHNRTGSGIAFASNIDPQMFEIYMKQTSQKDFASQFPWDHQHQKMWLEGVMAVKLAKITINSQSNAQERLIVSYSRKQGTQIKNYLSVMKRDNQNMINTETSLQLDKEVKELHAVGDQIFLIVKNSQNGGREYDASIISYNSKLQLIKSRNIPSYIISYASNSLIYYISRTSNFNYFNLYQLSTDLTNSTQYGVSNYLQKSQQETISSIYFRKGNNIDQDVFLVFGDGQERTWMAQFKFGNIHKIKTLTYGLRANVIDKADGNLIISLEGSYNHGGLLLNNNAENKCLLHKNANSEKLAHLSHLVNILEGSLEDLMAFLNDDSEQIVTACHPTLVLSKHMNGANVELASVWDSVFISTKYVSLNSLELMESLFSGGSNYEAGLRKKQGFLVTSLNGNRRLINKNKLNKLEE